MERSRQRSATLPSGLVDENGNDPAPYPCPREAPPVPKAAITAARVIVEFGRFNEGFFTSPMNLNNEVPLVDEKGQPRLGLDLRTELHKLVDSSMDRVERFQRGEE